MGKNMQQFGAMMASRMSQSAKGAIPTTVELGTINGNLSLSTSTMQNIPRGQYMVDITLKARTYRTEMLTHRHTDDPTHTHSDGLHDHRLPEEFRALRAGDRVIVLWVGNEPVVVAIVESS